MDELENVLAIPREEVHPRLGQGRDRRRRDPRGDRRAHPAAEGRPDGPAPGPDLRQPLRRLQGRRSSTSASPRARSATDERGPADGQRRERRAARARRLPAAAGAGQAAHGGRGRLRRHGPEERPRRPGRRHRDERDAAGGCAAARLPAGQEPRLRRHLPGVAARTTRCCATRSRSSTSTTRASPTSRRARSRSASGSAAASSACSTWRSSRSASSASSAWTSSPRRHRSSTTSS